LTRPGGELGPPHRVLRHAALHTYIRSSPAGCADGRCHVAVARPCASSRCLRMPHSLLRLTRNRARRQRPEAKLIN
jgi:hypothetical protein